MKSTPRNLRAMRISIEEEETLEGSKGELGRQTEDGN